MTGADQSVSSNGATYIVNQGTGTSITQTSNDYLLIENQADASIDSITLLPPAIPPFGRTLFTTIINRGTIEDDLVFVSGGIYVNDGGTITGNLTSRNGDAVFGTPAFGSGFTSEIFVTRASGGAPGVGGILDPGNGVDGYVQSFSASGSYVLPNSLPTNFEVGGVEALGSATVVTIVNDPATPIASGLFVLGNGSIVNQAEINPVSLTGSGLSGPAAANVVTSAVFYYGVAGESRVLSVPVVNPVTGAVSTTTNLQYGGALTSFVNEGVINGDLSLNTASFVNSGELNLVSNGPGALIIGAADSDFSFANSGTIAMTANGPRQFPLFREAIALASALDTSELKAVSITNSGEIGGGLGFYGFASDFVFENSGTISTDGNNNDVDAAVELEIGGLSFALDPALRNEAVANSVTIINTASGVLNGGIDIEATTRTFAFTNHGTITQDQDVNNPFYNAVDIQVEDYDNDAGEDDAVDAESASFVNTGTIAGSVEIEFEATVVTIDNSGTISRALTPGATLFTGGVSGLEVDQETTLGATLHFANSGMITTADYAGVGVELSIEAGNIDSGVAGAENANGAITVSNSGTISATGGAYLTPGQLVGLPGNQLLIDFAVGLTAFVDATGASSVSITNEADGLISARGFAHLGLPEGTQLAAGQTEPLSGVAVAAGADTVTIVNHGTILGGVGGPLALPSGAILVPLVNVDVDFEGRIGGAIDTFGSADDITNSATGVIEGGIALRSGDDTLRNYGTITGDIYFGTGNDTFTQGVNATFTGTAFGGEGEDRFQLDITDGTLSNAIFEQFVSQLDSFEILGVTGSGNIDLSSGEPLPIETIELSGTAPVTFGVDAIIETQGETAITGTDENNALVVLGTINGNVDLGDGDNSFTLGGTVNGNVAFGVGSDALLLQNGWAITGTVAGGAGIDSLGLPVTGSVDEPTPIDLSAFSDFEILNIGGGGVGTVADELVFENVNINDGRLIGLAGSIINGDIDVAQGGIFGSAGTVNGDINVSGTLSPGASPGTMTINGDVTLASGSTTIFEMTPLISDAIIIDGALTIETGTTLSITGERVLTPGATYDLIATSDGITGTFTNVDKAETVPGFLRYTENSLQLLGIFRFQTDANPQVVVAKDYVNSLLFDNVATAGLIAAIPDLVDADGFASQAAFATLHPEAYASASQIGVENGLAISSALRSSHGTGQNGEAGAFVFGQGFGSWRNFGSDAISGVSKANIRSAGVLGGIGYGNETASLSAFVGHVDSRQTIGALDARNNADGTFFGASAQLMLSDFHLGGSVVFDRSTADTNRSLFDGTEAQSAYRLRGTTADLHAGYGYAIGGGWNLGPQIGITHVSVKRGAASETGAGAFNLNVAKDSISYTFLTADLAARKTEGVVRPWLTAGLRQRINDDQTQATASLTGVVANFTVSGVQRNRSYANIGAGLAWQLSPSLSLSAQASGEFGGDNNAQSVNTALRLQF